MLRNGLEMPCFLERNCMATKFLKVDVYVKDTMKDEWQHFFSIVKQKIFSNWR